MLSRNGKKADRLLSVRLTADELQRLDRLAEETGQSRSYLVRFMLGRFYGNTRASLKREGKTIDPE